MPARTKPCRDLLRNIARRAMLERGLEPDFSQAAQREAAEITRAAPVGGTSIRDLRELLWCSIDNDDSRDLDQLTVAEPLERGVVRVFVAIADVDALVVHGSAIDAHARTNTTSVYTAARVFPMLPEKLSTDLTSLNQDEDRLAICVELEVAPDGVVQRSALQRAAVRSRAKLAYNSVAAWLEHGAPPPDALSRVPGLDEQIRLQDRVTRALRERRKERGAMNLDTGEARAVFEGDALSDLRPDEKNRAKELIEDLMIAANGASAAFLERANFPSVRRILRTPKNWDRIVAIAHEHGRKLPAEADARALADFLAERSRADPLRFPDLSLAVVKSLGSGEYAAQLPGRESEGHFGLAVRDYAHSTAPNRRFPDLVTQRLIKAALEGRPPPYSESELVALADDCTQQENNADKVERQVRKSAAALLLEDRVGEQFDAIVTGASAKGTWVRIARPTVEGKLVAGYERLDVGDRVQVELVRTDVEQGFIDFARVRGAR